ncbi:MAG: GDSL-type esterase/lipase family protein, partial [Marinicella pacifica]
MEEKIKALEEFITLNIGTNGTPAASTATVTSPTPAPAPAPQPTTNSAPSTIVDSSQFQRVQNGVRPKTRKIIPIISCQNRFQTLSDLNEGTVDEEVRLVGDSMVRGQLSEFCARAPKSRKRFCIPGGGVDDVIATVEEVANQAPSNTTYVIHVGTNDVQRTASEDLLNKYRRMIGKFKEKTNNVIISGIIPRMRAGSRFYDSATSINRRLATMCREENVGFVDTWNHFFFDRSLFSDDDIHLNQVGAARFGRLLNDAVKEFRSKNVTTNALQAGTGIVSVSNNTLYSAEVTTRTELISFYANSRSIHNKFSDFEELVYTENYDIMGITESWLNFERSDYLAEYKLPGYT